jgi:RNA polymerase sigma-70 factor, ECF subfamily
MAAKPDFRAERAQAAHRPLVGLHRMQLLQPAGHHGSNCNGKAVAGVEGRVMQGVDRHFERMVHEHKDRVFAASLAMTGNRHDAEDVAQDTFLRAYRALETYSPERIRDLKERAWLHRITVNVVRNRVRGVKPQLVELNGSESDHSPGTEAKAMEHMQIDELATRVADLPIRYREAVVLRHVRDLSYAEVAEALGQPVGTVKANVHRGLKLLRGEDHDRVDD